MARRDKVVPFTFLAILSLAAVASTQAASLSVEHQAKLAYDFGNQRVPEWSGGALVNFVSNRTAAPTLLSFDEQGQPLQAFPFTVAGAEMIDLDDIARGADGSLAVCGSLYEGGKRSGFFAIVNSIGQTLQTVRLYPYYPSRITMDSDGTVWTTGLEVVNGKEENPGVNLEHGVLRHFDRSGKLLGSLIPRSSLASPFVAQYGKLKAAKGRIGWYTGPSNGPGSQFIELLSDGTIRKYPAVALNKSEMVTGLALTDDGSTYVTTQGHHSFRFLAIGAGGQHWTDQPLDDQLRYGALYGSEGSRLVFHAGDRFGLAFVDVKR